MRILSFDELTPSLEGDRNLLQLAAFGGYHARRAIDIWRRRGGLFAEYVGLFAVEGTRLLGQVYVMRIPYTFPEGVEAISGIASVATRPDRSRHGVARALLEDAHRREREAGMRFSALWTNRSWGAHRLYEELGYRDVYSPPWAVHSATGRRATVGTRDVRPARRSDLEAIERVHGRTSRGRLGFCRPRAGYFSSAAAAGELDPGKELIVSVSSGEIAGYALVDRTPLRTISGELCAISLAARRDLINEVGRLAGPTPWAFQHSVVRDAPQLFPSPEFAKVSCGWFVLMAAALGARWTVREACRGFATNRSRFLCLAGDRF